MKVTSKIKTALKMKVKSGQVKSGHVKSGQDKSVQVKVGQGELGQVQSGQVDARQVRTVPPMPDTDTFTRRKNRYLVLVTV